MESKNTILTIPEEGFVLNVDKPYGWTSFQAVNYIKHKIKNLTGIKKFKIGHAGTLDPLATGVLVICVGKKTKTIPQLQDTNKVYKGTFLLGCESASYDLETPVKIIHANPLVSEDRLAENVQGFLGDITQTAPSYSAKKVNGKRAYESARKGEAVDIKPHQVKVHGFDLSNHKTTTVDFEIACSKGTYIRSIAHDFGASVGCGALLAALRRTAVGNFESQNALKLKEVPQHLDQFLVPV